MYDAADLARLQTDNWLSRQPEDFRRALFEIVTWRRIQMGFTINPAGADSGGIWGVASGQVDITSAWSTAESPIADIYLPGQWAGIGPIFGQPRGADGTTRVDSLIAYTPLPRLQAMLREHPEWWFCFGQLALESAFRYGGATGDLLIGNSRQRCIAVLLRLGNCRRSDPAAPPAIILSHSDLANAANLSRHTAGEVLRDLDAAGLIELSYRQIVICNPAALRAIVDG